MHELYFGKSPESERMPIKGRVLTHLTTILQQQGYLKKDK